MQPKKSSGGARENAGAKPKYNEMTKTVSFRCPNSKITELKSLVKLKLKEWQTKKENAVIKYGEVEFKFADGVQVDPYIDNIINNRKDPFKKGSSRLVFMDTAHELEHQKGLYKDKTITHLDNMSEKLFSAYEARQLTELNVTPKTRIPKEVIEAIYKAIKIGLFEVRIELPNVPIYYEQELKDKGYKVTFKDGHYDPTASRKFKRLTIKWD
jgi:hypothetical protein